MESLNILLGAGFSRKANISIAKEINNKFNRGKIDNVLQYSSGEFVWACENQIDYFTPEVTALKCVLNELHKMFINENKTFSNYENYYQFIINTLENEQNLIEIRNKAYNEFYKTEVKKFTQFNDSIYEYAFRNIPKEKVVSLFNHLIADLLYFENDQVPNFAFNYEAFFSLIRQYDEVNIFTLNHDLLLESLLEHFVIDYSDGFSTNESIIVNDSAEKLRTYKGKFNSKIKLVKLHGSIDLYKYDFYEENGAISNPSGEYKYFKTTNYQEKQSPYRIDLMTGEKAQTFHGNISPQFITGSKKLDIITRDCMYNDFYKMFETNMKLKYDLLIIGYSFQDEHINEHIRKCFKNPQIKRIINVNPTRILTDNIIKEFDINRIEKFDDITQLK